FGEDTYVRSSSRTVPCRPEPNCQGASALACDFVSYRPSVWDSNVTDRDRAGLAGRYSDAWQRQHLYDPRSVVPESNMPAFPWLFDNRVDHQSIEARMSTLQTLGVPYTDEQVANAADEIQGKFEIEALVSYLQQLGTVISEKR
ncbi:MAG: cbb3-type cytochrome c oxidase subunit II, partial [Alteromonadaceae bacterium]|nr:cbb3-type cytochrome c oxidase subunit II [Alteromonadaceae bacterium]